MVRLAGRAAKPAVGGFERRFEFRRRSSPGIQVFPVHLYRRFSAACAVFRRFPGHGYDALEYSGVVCFEHGLVRRVYSNAIQLRQNTFRAWQFAKHGDYRHIPGRVLASFDIDIVLVRPEPASPRVVIGQDAVTVVAGAGGRAGHGGFINVPVFLPDCKKHAGDKIPSSGGQYSRDFNLRVRLCAGIRSAELVDAEVAVEVRHADPLGGWKTSGQKWA